MTKLKAIFVSALLSLACMIISLWLRTLRVSCENEAAFEKLKSQGYVLTFWHSALLLGYHHHRSETPVTLLSLSRDGESLAKLTKSWGYTLVRGSRHNNGSKALSELQDCARKCPRVVLTPDGSRGPAREMKPGAVIVARNNQLPLIAAGIAVDRAKKLNTWDNFCIPMPFSRVVIVYSDPIRLAADLDSQATDQAIKAAGAQLNHVHDLAAKRLK